MKTIYVKTTLPSLPEAVRTTINTVVLMAKTPELQLKKLQAMAVKRKLEAVYELSTPEEYKAFRAAQKAAIEVGTVKTLEAVAIQTPLVVPADKKSKAPKAASAPKGKRVSLNPQPIIDAKTAALKEKGIKLTYAARQWKAGDRSFSSLEFSKYSVEDFAALFPAKA
jgi:hypothetical protein